MTYDALIQKKRLQSGTALTEVASKQLLAGYGLPVTEERLTTSETDALEAAGKIGYPVVLKGVGANLTHKTERGVVKTDLRNDREVIDAFHHIKRQAASDWEGCVVQPMLTGKRELVAGLIQDPQFGPAVMFGLGGVFTEVMRDVVFRIAPVSSDEADRMINAISSRKLLSDFRGEAPANREQLRQILTGLSSLGLEHPEVAEIDINPLIVQPDGQIVAVDALVLLRSGDRVSYTADHHRQPRWEPAAAKDDIVRELHTLFHAESIAIIGASPDGSKLGNLLARGFIDMGYGGKLHFVNPSATGRIFNQPVYQRIEDVPGEVALVVICTPPSTLPGLLAACARKHVKGIVLFVAPTDRHPELQRAIDQVKSTGARLIGPNSMGVHCPASGMAIWPFLPKRAGSIGGVFHSGGVAFAFLSAIEARSIGCSKAVTVGNEWDLTWTDYLAYLGEDDDTDLIAGYLEGMVDGRRFLSVAAAIGSRKPIICIKGGDSEAGNAFAGSHTGGMAGSRLVWQAAFEQANIVKAVDFQDLITHVVMFKHLMHRPLGRRVGLVTGTGGPTVVTTDLCEQYGLEIPALSASTRADLLDILPPFGTSCHNPVDVSISAAVDQSLYTRSIQILDQSDDVDVIVCIHTGDSVGERLADRLIEENRGGRKPLVVIMTGSSEMNSRPVSRLLAAGIPAFDLQDGTIRALRSVIRWQERVATGP